MSRPKKPAQPKTVFAASKTDRKSSALTANLYRVRGTSKLGKVLAMLHQKNGATIEALCKAAEWQRHTVRGALSRTIKKKLGLAIVPAKTIGVRTYRMSN